MHHVVGLLPYVPYNLILSRIITGRWGPAVSTLLVPLPNVNLMPANLGAFPTVSEAETFVTFQCPEFYAKDSLILSQCILWKFPQTVSEALLVVNHQLYVGLGSDSSPPRNSFLLSNNFHHSPSLCLLLVFQAHKEAGHEGIAKTYGWLQKNYFWENLRLLIPDAIASCHDFQL
ncbi:hypothetical protein DSO57_1001380 [Entomophthora muscae]|uniref:Uncharacterized protein n=1 Tax=Entomophthora muscae TaxID=34485 RepID=A0ACC2SYB6_9FUNG|nr:hypothetical protein DSO57_1001380 [Entomophthora muscae]